MTDIELDQVIDKRQGIFEEYKTALAKSPNATPNMKTDIIITHFCGIEWNYYGATKPTMDNLEQAREYCSTKPIFTRFVMTTQPSNLVFYPSSKYLQHATRSCTRLNVGRPWMIFMTELSWGA